MYDLVIIGAGPGGYVTAIRAAQLGMNVALIEKGTVGGTCLNRGCIPTKALLHAGEVLSKAREGAKFGLLCGNPSYSAEGVSAYRNDTVKRLRTGTEALLKSNNVTLLRGTATFVDPHNISIESADGERQTISGKNIIIATGSTVNEPNIPGIHLAKTSDDILEKDFDIPQSVAVAGASIIGVEFAEMFNAFGKDVTIIATRDRLLPKNDKDLGIQLGLLFKKKGISICYHCRMKSIEKTEDGKLKVWFSTPDGDDSLVADMIVSCVGRKANLENLKPENAGVRVKNGAIAVNADLRTNIKNIYAIGDCTGGDNQLAHVASAQGIYVVEKLARHKPSVNLKIIPTCVYTSPEAASVGMTEDECDAAGIEIETGKFLMSANGKSVVVGLDRGFVKTVFEKKSGRILGAQLLCDRATDIVAELGVAIANGLKKEQILKFIHPHPTIAESVAESVDDSEAMAIHLMKKIR